MFSTSDDIILEFQAIAFFTIIWIVALEIVPKDT